MSAIQRALALLSWIVAPRRAAGAAAAAALLVAMGTAAMGQGDGWSGNFAKDPGFEEDSVNLHGEGHVLSFKGDWYYNQQDGVPDYWNLKGNWSWPSGGAHSGAHYLRLGAGATAEQSYHGAIFDEGGSSWSGASPKPIPVDAARYNQPWRAGVWVRGGGSITLGGVTARSNGSNQWTPLTVEVPAAGLNPAAGMTVTLTGPGEFDDLVVQEHLSPSPNLIPNAGFEEADAMGHPVGWSEQRKYRAIGPTYYVWTDWDHFFSDNRGAVRVDPLVSCSGKQSLRFDVYPGDEKYVESDPIVINQTSPELIEVGVMVKADRARIIDVRCVDQDGTDMPGVYPIQPENHTGGTATWGSGTFDWRYVRKCFAAPFGRPIKSFRVRLCARGFNGHTLAATGTRPYCCQVGTIWWDDIHVCERCTDASTLAGRGVKTYPLAEAKETGPVANVDLDLGERFYGLNDLSLTFTDAGPGGTFRVRLTTTLPGEASVQTLSPTVKLQTGQAARITVPYEINKLAGNLKEQGTLRLELFRDTTPLTDTTYAFNTWPVIVNFDVARSYSLPNENPDTTAINFGVSSATLAKVAKLEMALVKESDPSTVVQQLPTVTDLPLAFAQTLSALPTSERASFEFDMPTPAWWADHTNLLMLRLDLSALKVWPHDNPTRDTALMVRGLDSSGHVLFEDKSDPFCRMEAPPRQPPIQSVSVRDDGAILINDQPRFLFGASHQNFRVAHTPELMSRLGLMGMRVDDHIKNAQMDRIFETLNLYQLQAKPDPAFGSTQPVTEMTPAQRQDLGQWAGAGGMREVVTFNTGGWEASINPDDPKQVAGQEEVNAFVGQATHRPVAISSSGAYNAWWLPELTYFDVDHAETEMWGPMDFNVIFTPYMKRARKTPTAWVYLPQLYDNTPYERYRFETYENIIRGSAGDEMIQGIGDPSLNRGLAGELRGLAAPLYSLDKAPDVTFEPNISHKVTSYRGNTYILATNAGPIIIGKWKWDKADTQSGSAAHEGDTVNQMWFRPAGIRIHGFRGLPMPELIQAGDKIVQYVWLDPQETPDWVMLAVRGDGKFTHNAVLGNFSYDKFRSDYGNIVMYSELNHSVWHAINYVFDEPTYHLAIKLMGQQWADKMKQEADKARAVVDATAYQARDFQVLGGRPGAGKWVRIEVDAEKFGLVGKLVDGFAFLTQNGRARWDSTVLERNGQVARVFCQGSVGIDRALLPKVRINVPGLHAGTKINVAFEDRTITADEGGFTDNFVGTDTYGCEAGAVVGDMFGFVTDPNRDLPRMMPSGYGYSYGPTAVHIYEIGK